MLGVEGWVRKQSCPLQKAFRGYPVVSDPVVCFLLHSAINGAMAEFSNSKQSLAVEYC